MRENKNNGQCHNRKVAKYSNVSHRCNAIICSSVTKNYETLIFRKKHGKTCHESQYYNKKITKVTKYGDLNNK